jgi:hypothetical protein
MGKKKQIVTKSMLSILKQTYLGGTINECVLSIEKGKGTIEAVDITNTLVFISTASVASKKVSCTIGLGNIEMIIKFLSTMTDSNLHFKLTDDRMLISRKDKRRRLDYLLTQPSLVGTRLRLDDDEDEEEVEPLEAYLNTIEVRAELNESFVKDIGSYLSTLKTKSLSIKIKDKDVAFTLGPKTEHQFKLSLPLMDSKDNDFSLKINGEYLAKILSSVEFDEDNVPTIGFSEEGPVVIECESSMWAITPSEEIEE